MSQQTESSPQPHILRACYGLSALCISSKPHNNLIPHMISKSTEILSTGEAWIWFQGLWDSQIYALFMSLKSQTPAEGGWVLERCHPAALLLKRCWPWEDLCSAKTISRSSRDWGLSPSIPVKEHLVFFKYENRMKKNLPFAQDPCLHWECQKQLCISKVNPLGHDVLLLILCIVGFDLEKSLKKFYIFVCSWGGFRVFW